ncbi:hypothetical protein PHYPSEUDO_013742 [Phytophthora pseudosyringae]|uniref:Uncharacterized protein n=1 Tax=Phytophthora pseudosyringae TaxID=221518 RepID=A0A8T1W299_9STRA|nr:hypothetical protein PHYPSEUDO_013742 [Phytophthora pseudosyringae]
MSDLIGDATAEQNPTAETATTGMLSSDAASTTTVSETLEYVQQGLGVHTSASRSILLHICQRLARLEASVNEVRGDVYQLRHDTNQGSETVRGEVSGVHVRVNSMSSKLKEYENVIEVFQNDMRTHQNHLTVLSTKVKKEKEHIQVVDTKVENHRQDINNRFVELTQKFQELPLQLAALQTPSPSHIPEKFTFQTNDEKLSLQTHLQRLDGSQRSKGYTDLQPFTIPEDMKSKVEKRIRQQEASKREADARAAAELADAYRRLQLASANSNNPRLSELHFSLDQCQQEVKRAFQLIRTSNLQLYSYCESKAERMEITVLQNEVKQLRSRLREIENSPTVHRSKQPQLQLGIEVMNGGPAEELMVGEKVPQLISKKGSQHLTSSQIPVLRVSLLELSRNLNLLKHRWKKHKRLNPNSGTGVNPVAQKHLEKLVALINDAYASMAQEPVDLAAAAAHVEKVGRVLGSDFSMQILALLGGRSDEPESCRFPVAITARAAAGEMATALCRYSEAFTDMFFRHEADNKVATAAMNEWASEKRTLQNVGREVSALTRSHHALEMTLAKLAAAMQKKGVVGSTETGGEDTSYKVGEGDTLCTSLGDELQQLKVQIEAMSKQFITEVELVEILRDLKREQQNAPLGITGAVIKHRYQSSGSGAPPLSLDSPSSASLLKRPLTSENDSSANKMIAAITLEPPEDRPRSQTKLDPLQVVKMNGSARHPGRTDARESLGASTGPITSRIQARAQVLRPKSRPS